MSVLSAGSQAPIEVFMMARVIITLKIMPESPETDLAVVQAEAEKAIAAFDAQFGKAEIEPIAFGLNALKIFIIMEESKGATDPLEEQITAIDGVRSVTVIDVRRTIG